jgi:hypothetical protein
LCGDFHFRKEEEEEEEKSAISVQLEVIVWDGVVGKV